MATRLLILGLCLCLPLQARADEMVYCAQLSDLYRRYLGLIGDRAFPDVTAAVAMDDCARGNTAAGIPVLENRLRDARFTLPKRT